MLDKTERTSQGLKEVLFAQLDKLRAGQCEPSEAKAVAAVVQQVINVVNMEIAVAKLRAEYPPDTKLICPPPLKLDAKGF